ncbi:MAG: hypothetical protein HY960_02135 [Ignavibacteriae bacterium]|nr:hypothetical protein [Ignavibacteriota bacterium]
MAKNEVKRLSPKQRQRDIDAFEAVKGISGYSPSKPTARVDDIQAVHDAMKTAQTEEVQAYGVADEKRDIATAKEWEFHNGMLEVAEQVIAQYGSDSNEIQKLGYKKKSEYKSPTTRTTTTPTNG